jgi:hypothetical protein
MGGAARGVWIHRAEASSVRVFNVCLSYAIWGYSLILFRHKWLAARGVGCGAFC